MYKRRKHQSQPDLAGKYLTETITIGREIRREKIWREVHIRQEDYILQIWRGDEGRRTDILLAA